MNKSALGTIIGTTLLGLVKNSGSLSEPFMTELQFYYIKFGFYGGLVKGFDLVDNAHDYHPDKLLDFTLQNISLEKSFSEAESAPKFTKDQAFELFVLDCMEKLKNQETDNENDLEDSAVYSVFSRFSGNDSIYSTLVENFLDSVETYREDFDKKVGDNDNLYKLYNEFFISPYIKNTVIPKGTILYLGLSSKVTNEDIFDFKDSFWCSHSVAVAMGFSPKESKLIEYEVIEDMNVQEMGPFSYVAILQYQVLLNTGFYPQSVGVGTYERRSTLREMFCDMGKDGFYIKDYYIKKDFFLPNKFNFVKFSYLSDASDFLICSPDKVKVKNIYYSQTQGVYPSSKITGDEKDEELLVFVNLEDLEGNLSSFFVDKAVDNPYGTGKTKEAYLRSDKKDNFRKDIGKPLVYKKKD